MAAAMTYNERPDSCDLLASRTSVHGGAYSFVNVTATTTCARLPMTLYVKKQQLATPLIHTVDTKQQAETH